MRRITSPAFIFLAVIIVLSTIVFYLSMRSGVARLSLPPLLELSSANIKEIKEQHIVETGVPITSLSFSPNGLYLAAARHDNILHVWSTKDYHLIYTFQTESLCENCIAFSPDSRYVAVTHETRPNDVMIWDLETGKSFWESAGTLTNPEEYITSLQFNPDGSLLAGSIANKIFFWKVEANGCVLVREIVGHSEMVSSMDFSLDGSRLLTTSEDKTVKVWSVETGDLLLSLGNQTEMVSTGIFSADNSEIVTAGYDQNISIWNSQTGKQEQVLAGHTSPVISLSYSPNGKLLASGGLYEEIIIWDTATWKSLLTLQVDSIGAVPLAFSPDNKILATTSVDGSLRLWGVRK
jgi:WD40 repeat protein